MSKIKIDGYINLCFPACRQAGMWFPILCRVHVKIGLGLEDFPSTLPPCPLERARARPPNPKALIFSK